MKLRIISIWDWVCRWHKHQLTLILLIENMLFMVPRFIWKVVKFYSLWNLVWNDCDVSICLQQILITQWSGSVIRLRTFFAAPWDLYEHKTCLSSKIDLLSILTGLYVTQFLENPRMKLLGLYIHVHVIEERQLRHLLHIKWSNFGTIQYFFKKLSVSMPNSWKKGFTKCHENRLRINWLNTEKLTFLLHHPLPSDRL